MASAFVADFARMPTQRKVMVFVVIGALLGLLYWKFAYKALDEDLDAAQVEHDNKVSTNRRLAADIPAYEELRAHMTRLKELIEKNQTALPSGPELPAFFETLQHKVAESGIEFRKRTTRPEEPVESFIKVPVEFEMSGTFMQIKRFFASLIQRDVRSAAGDDHSSEPERIVSIENLSLTNPEVKNREIVMTAKFIAVTFRQEEKPAAGGPPTPSRPAAPLAPVAPPPPLPSPATPAGAKARVENALEKGDARDRKAAGAADAATGVAPAVAPPAGAAPAAAPPAGARPAAGSDRLKGGL